MYKSTITPSGGRRSSPPLSLPVPHGAQQAVVPGHIGVQAIHQLGTPRPGKGSSGAGAGGQRSLPRQARARSTGNAQPPLTLHPTAPALTQPTTHPPTTALPGSAVGTGARAHPQGLLPLHQPLSDNALPPEWTPQEFAAHKATRHMLGLTDAAKTGANLGWAGTQAGRAVGSLSQIGSLGEIGFPFAVGAILFSFYDAYSTGTDARKARDDYLLAIVMLEQQESALAKASADASAPPIKLEMLQANVQALRGFAASFEAAYYPTNMQPYLSAARTELTAMARKCAALGDAITRIRTRIDELTISLDSSSSSVVGSEDDAGIGLASEPDLQERVHALESAHQDMVNDMALLKTQMKTLLSRKHLKGLANAALTQAVQARDAALQAQASPGEIKALEARIAALEGDVAAFHVSARQIVFHPFEDLSQGAIKRVRDVHLQLGKAPVDLSTAFLGLLSAVEVGNFLLQATGLGFVGGVIGLGMARLDRMDARRGQAKASAAKLVVVRQAALAAQVYQSLQGRNDPQARRGRFLAWLRMRQLARLLRAMHRLTLQEKTRADKAAAATLNTLAGFILAGVAIGLSNPLTVIPTAVLAAVIGGGFVGSVGVRARQRGVEKKKHKARLWAARQVVRQHGVQGAMAMVDAPDLAALEPWQDAIRELKPKLMAIHGAKAADWDLLDPQHMIENEGLGMTYLAQALYEHARDIGPNAPCWEAELLKSLGMDASRLDDLLGPDAIQEFGTPARHKHAIHLAVCEFYGVKPYDAKRLGLRDKRTSEVLASEAANTISAWASGADPAVGMTYNLLASLAQDPQQLDGWMALRNDSDRKALREGLGELRGELALQGIGPLELWAIQEQLLTGESGAQALQLGGPLNDPAWAVNLLELLADPSWLDPAAPQPPLPVASDRGPQTVAQVLQAVKSVGRALRDAQTGGKDRPPADDPGALPGLSHSAQIRRRTRSLGKSVSQPLRSTRRSFQELGANPMASPQKALAQLHAAQGDAHTDLMKRILDALVKEIGGVKALESDPAVLAALQARAPQATVAGGAVAMPFKLSSEETRRAHLLTWLRQAADAADATVNTIETVHGGRKADSHSLARLRVQMEGARDLCAYLCNALEADRASGQRLLGIHLRSMT